MKHFLVCTYLVSFVVVVATFLVPVVVQPEGIEPQSQSIRMTDWWDDTDAAQKHRHALLICNRRALLNLFIWWDYS